MFHFRVRENNAEGKLRYLEDWSLHWDQCHGGYYLTGFVRPGNEDFDGASLRMTSTSLIKEWNSDHVVTSSNSRYYFGHPSVVYKMGLEAVGFFYDAANPVPYAYRAQLAMERNDG